MGIIFKLLLYLSCLKHVKLHNDSEHTDVHKYILEGYNRNARPVKNKDDQVVVRVNLYLISLDNFDIKSQTVDSRLFLEMHWVDEFLSWDPNDFDNTTRISIDSSYMWIPDLLIGNDEGPFTFIDYPMIGRATVHHDGNVVIWPYFSIKIGCDVKIVYYPFDSQTFYFRVGSWSFTTKDIIIDFLSEELLLNKYTKNGEWDILSTYLKSYNSSFGSEYYSRIEYHLTIQRKPLYYILNILAPVVVTSMLNVMCFILPMESAERVTFSTSIFLTMAVFLTIVSQSLPKTSDGVSVTFLYICMQLFGSFFTIIMNVMVLDLYHRVRASETSILAKIIRATCLRGKSRKENHKVSFKAELLENRETETTKTPVGHDDCPVENHLPVEESNCLDQSKVALHETLKMINDHANGGQKNDGAEVALVLNSVCLGLVSFWNVFLILFLIMYVSLQ